VMLGESARLSLLIISFTVASGVFDALGLTHAAHVWQGNRLNWAVAAKSAGSFLVGITMYWGAVRFLSEAGIVSAETQALLWLGVTIAGVAVLEGRFVHWPLLDQIIAVNVLASLGWLISRAGATAA
jgi:uncharacterized membrane protein